MQLLNVTGTRIKKSAPGYFLFPQSINKDVLLKIIYIRVRPVFLLDMDQGTLPWTKSIMLQSGKLN